MKTLTEDAGIRRWGMLVEGHGPLSVFMTDFDAKLFESGWFRREGLACPPKIAGSVLRRQAEFFHGRLCARQALRAHGVPDGDVPTGPSREPVWPAGIIGSISHSESLAAAIVLPDGPYSGAGIDIESILAADAWKTLMDIVVSDQEIAYLRTQSHLAPFSVLLTLVFSAKESFYKAMFGTVRRFLDFDAIRLTDIDLVRRTLSFRIDDAQCKALQESEHCRISYGVINERTVCTSFIW